MSITRSEVKSTLVFEGTNVSDWNYFGGLTGKMQSTLLTGSKAGLVLSGDTFSGSITIGGTSKVRGGGIAAYAKVCNVISECECSGSISIGASAQERNVGGISGFQETSCQATIKGCRIAGSINKGGEVITLTSSNIEDWMFKGSATEDSRGVKIENCGFNDK